MTAWMALRLVKFLGVALLGAGVWGALRGRDPMDRLVAAHGTATAGFLATWIGGYGLARRGDISIGEPWIGMAMLASLGLWVALVFVAPRPSRAGAFVVTVLATFSIASMVLRGHPLEALAASVLAGALVTPTDGPAATAEMVRSTRLRWFTWIARLEGTSLLVLFGLFMPLKYGAGIEIDGGHGLMGWTHGVMVILFMPALVIMAVTAGWSAVTTVMGFVASLVPFGTFVFEHKVLKD